MACSPNDPQKTQVSKLMFSYDYNDATPPYTWTELANTSDVSRFSHSVSTIETTDNSSDGNTPTIGIRRSEGDFSFSYYPQSTPHASHTAFEAGHLADEAAPVWLWVKESDVIATGNLACCTITNFEPTSDQEGVRQNNITVLPRYKPDYDVAEPVTTPP